MLEVRVVVSVENGQSISALVCKFQYKAQIPVAADLSHSGFLLHATAPSPLPCIIRLHPILIPVRCSSQLFIVSQVVPSPIYLRMQNGKVRTIPLPPKRTRVHIFCTGEYHPVVAFPLAIHCLHWSWRWSVIAGYNDSTGCQRSSVQMAVRM